MQKRTLIKLAAALTVALPLTGCSFLDSPDPNPPAELTTFKPTAVAHVVWSVNVGPSADGNLIPAVTDNAVYAAGANHLYRLDRQTGKTVWKVATDNNISAGVGSDGNYIAVGTVKGEVVVFDAEGHVAWKAQLPADIEAPPLVGMNHVIVRTSDTRITAFDLITGDRSWFYQGQAPALTLRDFTQMAWSPAGILIGQPNGRLLALNPQDGSVVFDALIGQAKGVTEVERLIDVVGRPWVDNEIMCASTFQGNLVCMNARNGRLLWNAPVNAVSGPVADGSYVYIVDGDSKLHAYDRVSGTQAWVNDVMLNRRLTAPIRIGSSVAVGDYQGYVTMMDPTTGDLMARVQIDNDKGAIAVPPVQCDYGAVFQTVNGQVAYVVQDALEDATTDDAK